MPTTTSVEDLVRRALAEDSTAADLQVYDVELGPGLVRVLVERPGGLDLEALTVATRVLSVALDAHDPISGSYTLEVSSPGLERPLRTQEHFAGHVGAQVNVKTRPGVPGERRVSGELVGAGDTGITIASERGPRQLAYSEIERARTVFEWGPSSGGVAAGKKAGTAKKPHAAKANPKNPNSETRSSATK